MNKPDPTLIIRLGDRSGDLRVEGHIYGVDVRIFGTAEFGLSVEQATTLRDRLTEAMNAIESTDETTFENKEKSTNG